MTAKTMPSDVELYDKKCGHIGQSRGNNLDEVYGTYSVAKLYAWRYCERLCSELDGRHLCVTSANTYMFTAQFEFDNPENGRPMVCHITPTQTYAMYLDMQHIDVAREAWTHYVELYSTVRYTSDEWASHDGHCRVIWVGDYAYIAAYDEVYRVIDPYKRAGGLRKRIELQRVGVVADDDTPYAEFGAADVAMTVRCGLVVTLAICVDACMMMHGSDAQGATVRLMD